MSNIEIERGKNGKIKIEKPDKTALFSHPAEDGGPGVQKRKIFSSHGIERREKIPPRPPKWDPVFVPDVRDVGPEIVDRAQDLKLIALHAEPKEIKKLADAIRSGRAKLPRETFWICVKCGFRLRAPGDADEKGRPCLMCNPQNYTDGGTYREMSEAEVKKWKAEQDRIWAARMKQAKEFQKLLDDDFKTRLAKGEFSK